MKRLLALLLVFVATPAQALLEPYIAKSFAPTQIEVGSTSTLTLTITNVLALFQSNVSFTDTFPSGLVVASTPALSNTCNGTITGATAGSNSIALTGGSIAILSVCTITVAVSSSSAGSYANTTGPLKSATGTFENSNTATLTVTSIDLQVQETHSAGLVVGTTGTYTIAVNNAGTAPTAGTITVSDTLPVGLSYASATGTGWSCGASGQVVTCTSTSSIAAGGTAPAISLNVSVAAIAVPSVTNSVVVAGGSESSIYTNNNSASDYTLVANPAQSTFSTSGQQTTAAGSVVFYSHVFVAGYAGNVTFSTADTTSPVMSGWSSALFTDSNCNGILDGSEAGTPLTGSVAVAAAGQVCIIEKVFVPATGIYGARDQTVVTAAFTPTSSGSSATLTQTDVTIVGGASATGLTLQKTVRNVTIGGIASANNTAASGQTLEYTINYSNASANSLGSILVNDFTPRFSVFVSAQCVAPLPAGITACNVTTQPAVGGQGTLQWTLSGALQGGANGSVLFRVTLQ